jgi:hypothetical protein
MVSTVIASLGSAAARAAAACRSRTTARTAPGSSALAAEQPQLLDSGGQQPALSCGPQQDACDSALQHGEVVVGVSSRSIVIYIHVPIELTLVNVYTRATLPGRSSTRIEISPSTRRRR